VIDKLQLEFSGKRLTFHVMWAQLFTADCVAGARGTRLSNLHQVIGTDA
jgi:hypothetical protein